MSATVSLFESQHEVIKSFANSGRKVAENTLLSSEYNPAMEEFTTSSAVANRSNAIKIMNTYCSRLPSFNTASSNAPVRNFIRDSSQYQCIITMPAACKIRNPVAGKMADTLEDAVCSAALEVVRQLYFLEELTENLCPFSKKEMMDKLVRTYDLAMDTVELEIWSQLKKSLEFGVDLQSLVPKPGTRRRRQQYPKAFGSPFHISSRTNDNSYHVYVMSISCESRVTTSAKSIPLDRIALFTRKLLLKCPDLK